MYGAEEEYIALAKKAKVEWYMYNQPKISSNENHKMANTYYDDPETLLEVSSGLKAGMKGLLMQDISPEDRLATRGW